MAKRRINNYNSNNSISRSNSTTNNNDQHKNATSAKRDFAGFSRYQFRVPIKPIDLSYGTKGSLLGDPKLNQNDMNVPSIQASPFHPSDSYDNASNNNNMNGPSFNAVSRKPSDSYPSPYAQSPDTPFNNNNNSSLRPQQFYPNDGPSHDSFNHQKDPYKTYETANGGYGYENTDQARNELNYENERSVPYDLIEDKFDEAIRSDDLSLCCKSLKDLVYFYPLKLSPARWIRAVDLFIKYDLLSLIWETIPLIPWNSNQDYQWCFEAIIESDLPPNFNVAFFAHNMFYTLVVNDIELSNKIKNYLLEAFYKADNSHDCMAVLSHINKFDPNYKIPSFLYSYLDPTKDNKN